MTASEIDGPYCSIAGRQQLARARAILAAAPALVDNPDPFVAYWAALGHVRRRQVYIAATGQANDRAGLRWRELDEKEQRAITEFLAAVTPAPRQI